MPVPLKYRPVIQIITPIRKITLIGALAPLNILSEIKPAEIVPKNPNNGRQASFIEASSRELSFASTRYLIIQSSVPNLIT